MEQKQIYHASNISDETKTCLAKLYLVQHEEGKPKSEFVNDLAKAGYEVSPRQFARWVARVKSGQSAISSEKLTGRAPALVREEKDIASGWVLERLESGDEVHLEG